MIDLYRKLRVASNLAKNGIWAWNLFEGQELNGKTLGVIGSGKIGERIIKIGQGLGMNVIVNTLHPSIEKRRKLGIDKFYSLTELLIKSDVVTVHVPGNEITKNLLSAEKLKLLKPTALLINTSPCQVVDMEALYKMLLTGKLAGAGIDYGGLNPKKYKTSSIYTIGLMNLPNVNLTPDMAWYTKDGKLRLKELVKQNIASFVNGKIINRVN
jgi:phosphoglycerate dehydrogenase-like enzyme